MLLLREGHSRRKVDERRLAYAKSLVADGYRWRKICDEDREEVVVLIRGQLAGLETEVLKDAEGGFVCVTRDGSIVAAIVAAASRHEVGLVLWIRQLVVHPEHGRRGIGFVTLASAQALIDERPVTIIGNCSEDAAAFYQKAGYSVSQPGETLALRGIAAFQLANEEFPCWIWRTLG